MAGRLNQPCRVKVSVLWAINVFGAGAIMVTCGKTRVPYEYAWATYVPAAAVIRGLKALSGFIGFKGCLFCEVSQR